MCCSLGLVELGQNFYMRSWVHLYFLLLVCSVLDICNSSLECNLDLFFVKFVSSLNFFSMNSDFGYGFLVFWSFNHLFNVVGLFLLVVLGFKVLQCGSLCKGLNQSLCDFLGKSSNLKFGFCSKSCFDGKCNSKISSCECELKFLEHSDEPFSGKLEEDKEVDNGSNDLKPIAISGNEHTDRHGDQKDCESIDEDQMFDVMRMRKLVEMERRRADDAFLQLEEERMAAATAAKEAMAMILRLQNDKSLMELKSNQYRRLTEEKQLHDQEVIRSLRWIILKHESGRTLLENQLRMCRQKLMKGDEGDQSEAMNDKRLSLSPFKFGDDLNDVLLSSLDKDLAESAT